MPRLWFALVGVAMMLCGVGIADAEPRSKPAPAAAILATTCRIIYFDVPRSGERCDAAIRRLSERFGDDLLTEMHASQQGALVIALIVLAMDGQPAAPAKVAASPSP